ncbi:MAG TPA: adenylate/guanylate cyclase domain-containing protein [Gemmatimonadaceae bacterium]|nr:adenylate/guanylate cyclase domain-containing protein [Gemmatimonadaceae bacterium]
MPFRLTSTAGDQSFELQDGATFVVGRASVSDLPVFDPTISRRHAELTSDGLTIRVRDLGSSNGTFVNGARVTEGSVSPGDTIAFGKVPFRVASITRPLATLGSELLTDEPTPTMPSSTIIRERPFGHPGGLSRVIHTTNLAEAKAQTVMTDEHAITAKKLALLLEVSKQLSRAADVDALLNTIASVLFQILDVDRVAIELLDGEGTGTHARRISRDRRGAAAGRAIPQSIARKVVDEKVAVLSDNAPQDERFGGQSILMQSVRSAMCAPLIGSEDRVHGVLYVDNLTTTQRFDDDDLDFLVAFSNLAAVALENSEFAERIRRQTLVRSNFERFFAPNLAARIAGAPDAVRLGGEKRTVAVLFSDIRGFTALSEEMRPDDVAHLLTEYFSVMVEVVFRHAGTLDKFIGDAIMAQWGAPIGGADDADSAMAAALEMMRELHTLNEKWRARNRPALQIGVGLNYGESFAGYIGSERRLEYTVIGDAVNTASRLCAAAEGGEILLTGEMRAMLVSPPPMVERGTMELRGKSQSIPVYSVVP